MARSRRSSLTTRATPLRRRSRMARDVRHVGAQHRSVRQRLDLNARFRGQEGAPDAPMHSHLGVLGVTGFLMKIWPPILWTTWKAAPSTGAARSCRRPRFDDPDLSAFQKRGGKMIVADRDQRHAGIAGRAARLLPVGAGRMGRANVDRFARFFVMPQTGHGSAGTTTGSTAPARTFASLPIPNRYDQIGLLFDWVENGVAPGRSHGDRR